MYFSSHSSDKQYFSSQKIDENVVFLATTHDKSGLTRRELPCVVTRNETLSGYRNCILQGDIPPVVKFFRCLQSDNPPAEGLQEDSSPAQRLQADRPPGGHSSSQKNIQVKAASYTDEIQFDHHNLNSSSHPVPILPLNSGFSSC